MPDSQVCLEPKTEPILAKTYDYIGGDTAQRNVHWKGGLRTYLLDEGNNWGGDTAQHRKKQGLGLQCQTSIQLKVLLKSV